MRDRRLVAYRVSLKTPARSLRHDPTAAERKLWYEFLRDLPDKFTRQKPLGNSIADFFTASAQSYDLSRTVALEGRGLSVNRFTNLEVMDQFDAVCERIAEALAQAPEKT